ncbi:hypothetical protein ACFV98_17955 [Streptomyces violascens]|uniref:hypothetical protein n=1 Tax=Streptomyces violascens TaxID=67381 RepID=UPI00365DFD97
MNIWTLLESAATSVAPGDSAVARLRVRNTGNTVEEYRLSPLGEAAGWATVEPASLRLYPGTEGTAEITFAPPRTPDVPAGPLPYGIRVEPREHPDAGDVVEGRVTVGAFSELRAELVPRSVRGWRRARGRVAVDNLGNQPLTASFSARDNGDAVEVEALPGAVRVAPGRAGFAELNITPGKVKWVGGTTQHPFSLTVLRADSSAPEELRGTYIQRSLFPRWVLAAGSVLVAGAMALAIAWVQHEPSIKTQAGEKAEIAGQPLPQQNSQAPLASPAPQPSQAAQVPTAPQAPKTDGQPRADAPPPAPGTDTKPKAKGDGDGGGNSAGSPSGPSEQRVSIETGQGGGYLGMFRDKMGNSTSVYTLGWVKDQKNLDEYWILRRYGDGTVSLSPSGNPSLVLDRRAENDRGQLWTADGGQDAIRAGRLPANQKWRLKDLGDGWVSILSATDGKCLTDMYVKQNGGDVQQTLVYGCEDRYLLGQKWKIG